MRIIETKAYQFSELSDQAKEKAIEWYRSGMYEDTFYIECILYDAKEIGLKITDLDDYRCKGEFIKDAKDVASLIIDNHGKDCETFKDAENFMSNYNDTFSKFPVKEDEEEYDENEHDRDEEIEDLENDFLQTLCEDYRIMAQKEEEYQFSEEVVIENIKANEYEFDITGKHI
jgi:hypothetical protein